MLAEDRFDLRREPALVTELEGNQRHSVGSQSWHVKKAAQAFGIGLEVWRKLEEKQPQLPCLTHRLKHIDELRHIVLALAETLEVRDPLRRLEAEAETGRRRCKPVTEHLRGRQRAEGVVHLNRVQL